MVMAVINLEFGDGRMNLRIFVLKTEKLFKFSKMRI